MKTGPLTQQSHCAALECLFLSILLNTAVYLYPYTLHVNEIYWAEFLDNRNMWVFSVSWSVANLVALKGH